MKVSVAQAKNKLPELIRLAEGGEPVTICRRGVPVADLVPTVPTAAPVMREPKLGTLRDHIVIHNPD